MMTWAGSKDKSARLSSNPRRAGRLTNAIFTALDDVRSDVAAEKGRRSAAGGQAGF
jgi:hypothetical protein